MLDFLSRIVPMNRPLTPVLSRWERENCSPRVRRAGLLLPDGLSAILPLPAGERRGEGDPTSHGRFMESVLDFLSRIVPMNQQRCSVARFSVS